MSSPNSQIPPLPPLAPPTDEAVRDDVPVTEPVPTDVPEAVDTIVESSNNNATCNDVITSKKKLKYNERIYVH